MTAGPPSRPSSGTFVIRFWQAWSATGTRWRGRIEHVQSGESAAFLEATEILDFVRRFGIMQSEAVNGNTVE
jgi:hypothetical protein